MQEISNTNPDDPYTRLKTALIERYTLSESKRVETLISGVDIGDRTPSEFYRYLTTLAGSSEVVTDKLITELWMCRLPVMVQATLKVGIKREMQETLTIADNVYDVYKSQPSGSLHAVQGTSTTSTQAKIN